MSTWTQPICERCWIDRRSTWEPVEGSDEQRLVSIEQPVRLTEPEIERCSYCGLPSIFGVYVRDDPTKVPYPRADDGD